MPDHQLLAKNLASRIIAAWESEETLTEVFTRCLRGPKFDRTAHGRAIVMKLFDEAWKDTGALAGTIWDRSQVAYHLINELKGDYNLITQVVPNLLPVPLMVKSKDLAEAVLTARTAIEARPGIPNPFVEKRPKVKVTAATHAPEVVQDYTRAAGLARTASILGEGEFSENMSFRVSPLKKTPAFSDSMAYGQLPVIADAFLEVTPHHKALGVTSFYLSWKEDASPTVDLSQEDTAWVTSTLPEGRNQFISESGGGILGQVLWSRYVAGKVLEAWASVSPIPAIPLTAIPRLNSVQVIGQLSVIERILPLLTPLGVVGNEGARAILPEE